jgi:hypothetical protein
MEGLRTTNTTYGAWRVKYSEMLPNWKSIFGGGEPAGNHDVLIQVNTPFLFIIDIFKNG